MLLQQYLLLEQVQLKQYALKLLQYCLGIMQCLGKSSLSMLLKQ